MQKAIQRLSVLMILLFPTQGCAFIVVQRGDNATVTESEMVQKQLQSEKTRLIQITLPGLPCVKNAEDYPTGEEYLKFRIRKGEKGIPKSRCLQFAPRDFYPVELLMTHPGSQVFLDSDAIEKIGELYQYTRKNFQSSAQDGASYYTTYDLDDYKQFRNRGDYYEYRIKGRQVDLNWSAYLSFLSLMVLPGTSKHYFDTSFVKHSNRSGSTELELKPPSSRLWMSWIFLFWAQGLFGDNSEKEFYYFITQPLVEQAESGRVRI